MSISDTGGFDLAFELPEETALYALANAFTIDVPPAPLELAGVTGVTTTRVVVENLAFSGTSTIRCTLNLDGSSVLITDVDRLGLSGPVAPWLGELPIAGTVSVSDRLEVSGLDIVVDFTPNALAKTPEVTVALDHDRLLAASLPTLLLGQAMLVDPSGALAERLRDQLIARADAAVLAAVRKASGELGRRVVATAPDLGEVSVTKTAFRIGDRSVYVLHELGTSDGNPAAITRSALLRRSSDGKPLDALAVLVGNDALLRRFVRPALIDNLHLNASGFNPSAPCFWTGSQPVEAPPGGWRSPIAGATLTAVNVGVDEEGVIVAIAMVTLQGVANSFTVHSSATFAFSLKLTGEENAIRVDIQQARAPVVKNSDVDIAAWLKVGGAILTGGLGLAAVMEVIDRWGGTLLNAPASKRLETLTLPASIEVPLPPGVPHLATRAVSMHQSDAVRPMLSMPGPLQPIPIPSAYRSHDVIVQLT